MMTLDEMKLAVCGKLPKLIAAYQSCFCQTEAEHISACYSFRWVKTTKTINWPTEGLQMCHEAEKLLNKKQRGEYQEVLLALSLNDKYWGISATHEQRLEALCRVWWPERFE